MEITLAGWVLIPLGVVFLFVAPVWLYYLTIFLIPFSATAVLNMAMGGEIKGVPAILFIGGLWVCNEAYAISRTGILNNPILVRKIGLMCLLYLVIIACTLGALWQMPNEYIVHSPRLDAPQLVLLKFSMHNITQFMYLLFWVVMTFLIVMRNQNDRAIAETIKIFVMSAIFVSCWGLLQWLAFQFKFYYPYELFNSSASTSAQGYTGVLVETGLKRITSVAVEPSILAQCILAAVPFVFVAEWFKYPIFSVTVDRVVLVLLLLVLLLSTSTTAYIGILVFTLGFPILLRLKGKQIMRYAYLAIVLGVVEAVLVASAFFVSSVPSINADPMTQAVAHSFSIQERWYSIHNAWNSFLDSPLLGLGWGSVTSHDLIVNLLVNSGLIGLLGFFLLIVGPLKSQFDALTKYPMNDHQAAWRVGALCSFLLVLTTNMVSGFSFVFGHFWLMFALLTSTAMLLSSITADSGRTQVSMGESK